jgi:hypothetical protein
MAPLSPTAAKLRARHNALKRYRPTDDPEVVESGRELKARRFEEYVKETIAAAPALTDAQLERIAALLRAGRASAAQRPGTEVSP